MSRKANTTSEFDDSRTLLPKASAIDGPVHHKADLETFWTKLLLVPWLIFTTVISFLLIAGQKQHWTITGHAARTINYNPSTFSALRQVLASGFGAIYVWTICLIINWSSRITITRRPVTLDNLDFLSALVATRLPWTLPWQKIPPTILFLLLTRLPAAIWAGALAPVQSTSVPKGEHVHVLTSIPRYTSDSLERFSPQSLFDPNDPRLSSPLGIFSFSPIRDRFGFLLNDGASASAQSVSEVPTYKKNDNSNYTYSGRSYGVGSSVGLVDSHIGQRFPGLKAFRYNETGTMTNITCIINRTTDFRLEEQYVPEDGQLPTFWWATGCPAWIGPGQDCNGFSEVGIGGSDTIVAISWWIYPNATVQNFGGVISIASGANYTGLNNTQCSVSMVPTMFAVSVDVKDYLISVEAVTPQPENIISINPVPILEVAFQTMGSLSEVASTKFTSVLGNTLNSNIYNVQLQKTPESSQVKSLRAISEAMQVMTDDALVAFGSAQLMMANVSTSVPVSVTIEALTIGTPTYIYIIAGMNAAVVIVALFEAARTRGWKGMPRWNYMSVKSTAVSSSMGGREIGSKVESLHDATGKTWAGDANDRMNGAIRVRLRRRDGLALTLEDDGQGYGGESGGMNINLPQWNDNQPHITS